MDTIPVQPFTSRWQRLSAPPATIFELFDRYTEWGREHYQKRTRDGGRRSTREIEQQRLVMNAFKVNIPEHEVRYGDLPPHEFCAELLEMIRDWMVEQDLARGEINKRLHRIRRIFKWAAKPPRRWVPAAMEYDLKLVEALEIGRTKARESEPVTSAAPHLLQALQTHLAERLMAADATAREKAYELAQMIDLHLHTGARTGELAELRRSELHKVDGWVIYQPGEHKTQHHGKIRQVFLGPIAQRIVADWIKRLDANPKTRGRDTLWRWTRGESYRDQVEYAFDAINPPPAELQRKRRKATGRKSTRWETDAEWRQRLGDDWIKLRAWRKEHRFTPGQLRHNFATMMERAHGHKGMSAAQKLLGHSTLRTTQVYIDPDMQPALSLLKHVG